MHRTSAILLPSTNEVWGKVIFSQVSVILFTGGRVPACITGHMAREGVMPRGGGSAWGVLGCWADFPYSPRYMGYYEIRSRSGAKHPTGTHSCFTAVFDSLKCHCKHHF